MELFRREAITHATRRLSGEVVLAAPLSTRLLALFFTAIVVAAGVFAATATYARKATVTGFLIPDQGMIRVTATGGGLIRQLFVGEGDPVDRGQRLAEIGLDTEIAAGNVGEAIAKGLVAEAEALGARGEAEIAKLEAEEVQSRVRLSSRRNELEQARSQEEMQRARVRIAREQVTSAEGVAAKGLFARRDLEERQSAALAAEQALAEQRRQVESLEQEISDLAARLAAIPLEISSAQAEIRSSQASLERRSIEAEARRVQFVIAPISGRVAALPVTTGQALAPGASIAILTPVSGKLEAELFAPSRAVGFIKRGHEVQLLLQAFPIERFGTVKGEVKSISTTVLAPSDITVTGLDIKEPIFRVRAALSRQGIEAYGETIPLQPGMLLSADIIFDRRTLIQWLLDPLYAVGRRT